MIISSRPCSNCKSPQNIDNFTVVRITQVTEHESTTVVEWASCPLSPQLAMSSLIIPGANLPYLCQHL